MERPRSTYRAATRVHDLRMLLSSLLVNQIGGWAYSAALTIYVWDRSHSTGTVAAAALVRTVPVLLLSPYAGVLGDRFERVRLMVSLDLLNFVWIAAAGVAALTSAPVAWVLALATVSALTDTPYRSVVSAALPLAAGEKHLASANSLNGTIDNLTILVGPAVGAGLLALTSASNVFFLNAVTFLASAAFLSRMRQKQPAAGSTPGGRSGPLAVLAPGFRAVTGSPAVLLLTLFCALDSFYCGLTKVLYVSMSVDVGSGPNGYGYLLSAFGIGGVLAAGVTNRLASASRLAEVIVAGMAALYLPLFVQAWVSSPAVTAALQVIAGVGMLIVDVVAVTALQRAVPNDQLSRVFGVFWAIIIGAIALGSFLAPFALDAFGLDGTLILFGLGVVAVSVAGYPALHLADRAAARALSMLRPRLTILESMQIFAAASQPVIERLAAGADDVRYAAGAPIVVEGEPADALYVLTEGEVVVHTGSKGAADHEIRRMTAPCYFGEIGVLEHIPRTASVSAAGECTVLRIDGADFLTAVSESPASPSLVEGVRARLAVTHPHLTPALAGAPTQPAIS